MNELNSFSGLLAAILALAMIITFFVIANRIGKILNILEFFKDLALKDPDNWINIKCEKCGKTFRVAKTISGAVNCPGCKGINKVDHTITQVQEIIPS